MAIAAAALSGCGGGGEEETSPPSAQQAREAQAQADAELEQRNEQVRAEHRERRAAEAPSSEEAQATQAAAEAYQGIGALSKLRYLNGGFDVRAGLRRAEGSKALHRLCEFMSAEAQAQTIEYAEASSGIPGDWSCEKANALLVRRANVASGGRAPGRVKVLGVNADGDRATATIQVGGQPITTVPLVEEDGEWKLAATGAPE